MNKPRAVYNRQEEVKKYAEAVKSFYENFGRSQTIKEHLKEFDDIFQINRGEHWFEYGTD